ncbi:MAG TPA: S41 family peptidase [Bacteroidales bacterium]|nr:S41 family peptidase [Bacteroidales bacterium]
MKNLYLTLLLILFPAISNSQTDPLWLRYPAISPDGQTIAFTYKGDIYTVPSSGGAATALTWHEAHDFMPVWSHDGKSIAFASDRYGNFDIFLVPVTGGEPRRLTYHSANEFPYSFTSDDKAVIFGAAREEGIGSRQYPASYQSQVYSVPVNGGKVSQVWKFPAEDIKVSRDGNRMIYHDLKGSENQWRKHHLSSVSRDIWIFDRNTGKHTQLSGFRGEDRNPVFSPDEKSVYYLSEESGSFNIFSMPLDNPSQEKQMSFFKNNPVRFLSSSEKGTLCFAYDGSIYTMQPGLEAKKVSIAVQTAGKTNTDELIQVNDGVSEMAVSPNGKEVAFIAHGEVFATSTDGGITRRLTNTPGEERSLSFSPTGDTLLYASERGNSWKIFMATRQRKEEPYFYASTLIREEQVFTCDHDCYQPVMSPDGKEIAYIENRNSLKVYSLSGRLFRELLSPEELFYLSDNDQYFTWSPDSKWILATFKPRLSDPEVLLIRADGKGNKTNLTRSGYNDERPRWANGGKQMIWFSDRDGLRSYANSGRRQSDVYTLFMTKDAWDRFRLSKEEYALAKEIEDKNREKEKKEKQAADPKKTAPSVKKDSLSVKIEMDGIFERKARLTIHSSSLSDALLSKDAEKLYYLARFEKGLNLWSTNIRTRETKMEISLDAGQASMEWDSEMKYIYLLSDGKIFRINPEGWKKEAVAFRTEMTVDIAVEREREFDHVWNKTRATFYTSTFHGADWESIGKTYRRFLPYIGNGYEFAELLSEMLGELNVSHSGARYRADDRSGDRTASLGILEDYGYTGRGIRINEVLKDGPLDKSAFSIVQGMIIEQIDGDTISTDRDQSFYLNRKTGKFTLLTILNPSDGKHQSITVKPVSKEEESTLLYKRWVRKNQDEVDSLSKGQLGYVHIPGMSDGPYRSVYEEMMGRFYDRKGVIVDSRFNGGGDLVSDLTTFFTGRQYLEYGNEKRALGNEPPFRWTRPTVAVFNEANYSDGDCFACGYKQLGIGKTIGMPVPGTCSWANWEMLQDGTTLWGVIPISTRDINGTWMENVETVPDFKVKNEPGVIDKGKDQQLLKAVEVLLNEVK